jgi:ATP-binding cassette subfamily F protein 3
MKDLEGSDKVKVLLAQALFGMPDILLLDEPTNHLDIEMRHALTLALQEYQGGVVLVSHDRALLRATCDQFLLVDHGDAKVFDGDLDDYASWVARQRVVEASAQKEAVESTKPKINTYAQNKADRQARTVARRPLLKESAQLEKDIAAWQSNKTQCDEQLNDSALYEATDKSRLQQLLKEQAELALSIEQAEERWLDVHEQLESLPEIN